MTVSATTAAADYASINVAKTTSASSSSSSTSTSSASATLTSNYNTFLTLLTTQLQNQDPTQPMDSATFTQQLVEYSQVEQQIDTNTNLATLISQGLSNESASAVNVIGKNVEVQGTQVGLTDGAATMGYTLPSSAASATVTVTNSSGTVLQTITGGTASGSNTVSWDGTNSSGTQLADGTYNFSVTALDSSGKTITPTNTFSSGTVNSITSNSSGVELNVGPLTTTFSSIISVS